MCIIMHYPSAGWLHENKETPMAGLMELMIAKRTEGMSRPDLDQFIYSQLPNPDADTPQSRVMNRMIRQLADEVYSQVPAMPEAYHEMANTAYDMYRGDENVCTYIDVLDPESVMLRMEL